MRRALALAAAAACLCCSSPGYRDNDLQLITAYTAKEMCSCLFVLEQPEDFCRTWTRQSPAIATYRVDRQAKRVEASALLLWGASARLVDAQRGCALEPLASPGRP